MSPPFEIIGWEILTPWRGGYMALLCKVNGLTDYREKKGKSNIPQLSFFFLQLEDIQSHII
jgi:hypothetical protein